MRVVDVVDLHLDAGHAVAVLVEGLRLVEVGVDELRVVLVEAGLEDRDDAELFAIGARAPLPNDMPICGEVTCTQSPSPTSSCFASVRPTTMPGIFAICSGLLQGSGSIESGRLSSSGSWLL